MWEDNGKDSSIVEYKQDGTRKWIRIGNKMKNKIENGVFTLTDEMPWFPRGDKGRVKFLKNNIIYPNMARESGIQGTVYVTFIVEKDGSLSDVRILRGIGGGCDEEVIRIVKKMPKWKPGRLDDKPVRVQFIMPVKFTLIHKKKNKKNEYSF